MDKNCKELQGNSDIKGEYSPTLDETECIIDNELLDFLDNDTSTLSVDLTCIEYDTEEKDPSYIPPAINQEPTSSGYSLRSQASKIPRKIVVTPKIEEINPEVNLVTPPCIRNPTLVLRPEIPVPENIQVEIGEIIQEVQEENQIDLREIPQRVHRVQNMAESNDKLVERYGRILPPFSEDPNSLETFIRKADSLFKLLPDQNAKDIFLNCVKDATSGSTYNDVALLPTWEEVKQELKVRILPRRTITQLHQELASVIKKPSDTIITFADKIKRIANGLKNAHRVSDLTVTEEGWKRIFYLIESQALNTFIEGLSPQLRNWTIARDFKTLRDAENHCRSMEHLDINTRANDNQSRDIQYQNAPAVNQNRANHFRPPQVTIPNHRPVRECQRCHRVGHRTDQCFAGNIPRVNFSGIPRDTLPRGDNVRRSNFRRPDEMVKNFQGPLYQGQELLCTHCGGRNHTKESCYKLRAAVKCSYCAKAGHTITNCLRKISDQPLQPRINHMYYNQYPTFVSPDVQTNNQARAPLNYYEGVNTPQMEGYFANQSRPDQNRMANNIDQPDPLKNIWAYQPQNTFQILGPANIQKKEESHNLLNLTENE